MELDVAVRNTQDLVSGLSSSHACPSASTEICVSKGRSPEKAIGCPASLSKVGIVKKARHRWFWNGASNMPVAYSIVSGMKKMCAMNGATLRRD